MSDSIVRVQEKGQVTIPIWLRKKMNLHKGDLVVFKETEQGILIQPAEVIVAGALDEIGHILREKGVSEEQWISRARQERSMLIEEVYGLSESDS